MANEPVGHEEFSGRTTLCDERFEGINKRQNKLEDAVDVISKLDVKWDLLITQLVKAQEQNEQKICALEQKPGKRWELVAATAITLILGGVIGFVLKTAGLS